MAYVRSSRAPRVPTAAEQAKLLKVTGEHVDGFRDHMIFAFALGTGLREKEIASLNVGDVSRGREALPRIHLREFKNRRKAKGAPIGPQTVFVSRSVQRKIPKFIAWKKRRGEKVDPDAPLFCSNRGDRIATRTMRHMCQLWQQRADIKPAYNFHSLRHACLTNLYAATKDLIAVQRQARHSQITTTQIYSHVSDDEVRRAVEGLPS